MQSLLLDLRYAFRKLGHSPVFTAVGVLTLALGIGVNTAVFSAVEAVLLRSLPYSNPDQLVNIWETYGSDAHVTAPLPSIRDWQQQNHVFSDVAAYRVLAYQWVLTGYGEPARLRAVPATWNLFPMLGVKPELGRTFVAAEDSPEAAPVAIVSHATWVKQLGSDPNIAGKRITLQDHVFTVAGVLPESFHLVDSADVWLPIAQGGPEEAKERIYHPFVTIARLKPGVSLAEAQAEMATIAARLAAQYPATDRGWGVRLVGSKEERVGALRPALLVLFGSVTLVLLIACANLANLLLARATARQAETAVRMALGASRWRLVRQQLVESTLLGALGGVAGLAVAVQGTRLLATWGPADFARQNPVGLDLRVLMFMLGTSLLTGLLCGLLPAWQQSGAHPQESLSSGSRTASVNSRGLREMLVSGEIAISLVLLVGAGLLSKSFVKLLSVNPGFKPDGLLIMQLALPEHKLVDPLRSRELARRLQSETRSLPQVSDVAVSNGLPFQTESTQRSRFLPEGYTVQPGESLPVAEQRLPSANYFSTMSIPLREGRFFDEHDYGSQVVIINQSLARRFWPGTSAMGHKININPMDKDKIFATVVGVVGDIKQYGLDRSATFDIYLCDPWPRFLIVKTSGDPLALASSIRQVVHNADPAIAISSVSTMSSMVGASVVESRFVVILLNAFSAIALLIAVVGVYGVMSLLVTQRTREVGVRMALGAQVRDVIALILARGLRMTLIGWCVGLGASVACVRLLQSQLFEVRGYDPVVFVSVSAFLIMAGLAASYIPARRASHLDPGIALREQ